VSRLRLKQRRRLAFSTFNVASETVASNGHIGRIRPRGLKPQISQERGLLNTECGIMEKKCGESAVASDKWQVASDDKVRRLERGVQRRSRSLPTVFSPHSEFRTPHSAFTLVELLVVITIIGVLVALLLPAIQAAREAARKMQCTNNLKQQALGWMNHEQQFGHFPIGGWGGRWMGDPDRGFGVNQPGGWVYNILPFCELQAVHDMPSDGKADDDNNTLQNEATWKMMQTPVAMFNCPSRRPVKPYPLPATSGKYFTKPASAVSECVRSDYAANGGTTTNVQSAVCSSSSCSGPSSLANASSTSWISKGITYGVVAQHTLFYIADITDGLSNTYMIGEKFLETNSYETGTDEGDDWGPYTGAQNDNARSVYYDATTPANSLTPKQDYPMDPEVGSPSAAESRKNRFGAPHASGCNFAFCDGSVQSISYTIDPLTHNRLGNRRDGQAIDGKSY
jgi:prepilin-type N-terminal cleavage/methylation domain-containing protein/prepilin-type processing-associated H-X9-DG protein